MFGSVWKSEAFTTLVRGPRWMRRLCPELEDDLAML
jgi:hypothetical protein